MIAHEAHPVALDTEGRAARSGAVLDGESLLTLANRYLDLS